MCFMCFEWVFSMRLVCFVLQVLVRCLVGVGCVWGRFEYVLSCFAHAFSSPWVLICV